MKLLMIGGAEFTGGNFIHYCVDMIQTKEYGTYHATNEGICSWYEFACEIFKQANIEVIVHPMGLSAYPTRAIKPKNSRMNKTELDKHGIKRLPTWQDALERYLNTIKQSD